ncbi:MAG: hypothetical protein JO110_02975 [Acetobacteraceae bacterium]|nr:hypothetical protein [Acetobacteraceae bacterium]
MLWIRAKALSRSDVLVLTGVRVAQSKLGMATSLAFDLAVRFIELDLDVVHEGSHPLTDRIRHLPPDLHVSADRAAGSDPPIWRELEVPTSIRLKVLHDDPGGDGLVRPAAMGVQDQPTPLRSADGRGLGYRAASRGGEDLAARRAQPSKTIIDNIYDFGDNGEHRLTISRVRPGEVDLR